MNVYGITMDRNYAKIIDEYIIISVGISGPEVLSKYILKKGSILQIKKIEKCRNVCLDRDIRYSINLDPPFENKQKPIYISSDLLKTKTVENK